jgi:hypothetical protein
MHRSRRIPAVGWLRGRALRHKFTYVVRPGDSSDRHFLAMNSNSDISVFSEKLVLSASWLAITFSNA